MSNVLFSNILRDFQYNFLYRFLEGLEACGLKAAILQYPHQFQEVFCKTPQMLTGEMIEAVFSTIQYSEPGSNKRRQEEKTITYWCDLLLDIEGMAQNNGNIEPFFVNLYICMRFAVCMPYLYFTIQ